MKFHFIDHILSVVFGLLMVFWIVYAVMGEYLFNKLFAGVPYSLYLLLSISNYIMLLGLLIFIKLHQKKE